MNIFILARPCPINFYFGVSANLHALAAYTSVHCCPWPRNCYNTLAELWPHRCVVLFKHVGQGVAAHILFKPVGRGVVVYI